MAEPKQYVPKSGAKEHIFADGNAILKLSFKAADLIDFINQHANAKGYINLAVTKRRELGQYGDTHCVWLDNWTPKQPAPQPAQPKRPATDSAGFESGTVPF